MKYHDSMKALDTIRDLDLCLNYLQENVKEEDIIDFLEYLSTEKKMPETKIEKIKVLTLLLNRFNLNDVNETNKIISFIEQTRYGWHRNV